MQAWFSFSGIGQKNSEMRLARDGTPIVWLKENCLDISNHRKQNATKTEDRGLSLN
jgi:hypothetical protein